MVYYTVCPSPVGLLTLASDGAALTGLWMEGQRYAPAVCPQADGAALPVFSSVRRWLDRYFAGETPDPAAVPLALHGTAFRIRVWRQLLAVPAGTTVTYGALARAVGCSSARAVGAAVGRNPVAIIVPCHRVVGSGGALTGYEGGLARKEWLLAHEGALAGLSRQR